MSNSCKQKEMQEFLHILSHNFFSVLLLSVFESEIHVNPKNPRSLLHIHPQFLLVIPLSNPPTHSSILPKHLLWIRSFLPCRVSMGHRLGNFRELSIPTRPPTNPEIRSTTELVTKKFMEDGANLDVFCFNKKRQLKENLLSKSLKTYFPVNFLI